MVGLLSPNPRGAALWRAGSTVWVEQPAARANLILAAIPARLPRLLLRRLPETSKICQRRYSGRPEDSGDHEDEQISGADGEVKPMELNMEETLDQRIE
ncbi:unnamed protein product [Leuciscus chuanchicus]